MAPAQEAARLGRLRHRTTQIAPLATGGDRHTHDPRRAGALQPAPAEWARGHYGVGQPGDSLEEVFRLALIEYIAAIKRAFGGTIVWLVEADDYEALHSTPYKIVVAEVRAPDDERV